MEQEQDAMEQTTKGVSDWWKTILRCTAASFAFAEAASFALESILSENAVLLPVAVQAASRAGSTGVGVVTACLVCTSMLISLGSGFLLVAMTMKLLNRIAAGIPWLTEVATAVSLVLGAAISGVLIGFLPPWMYITAQLIFVAVVFFYSNINQLTQALLIIFVTLYVSVYYGRMGVFFGLFLIGVTVACLLALRKALVESTSPKPKCQVECKLLERIFFYSVVVAILGFGIGLGASETQDSSEIEVVAMLDSVLWVGFLSAGILGAGLGTVAMVGVGAEVAGKISIVSSVMSVISLRVILHNMSVLGIQSSTGGILGVTAAAGVSLGAASVVNEERRKKEKTKSLVNLGSIVVGVIAATKVFTMNFVSTPGLTTLLLTVLGAYQLGVPGSPFNTPINLRQGLLTGAELIKGIGMETVTAAAAPIGAGALGAAAMGTAALGKLGTVGVLLAITLALGSTLSGMIGRSLPVPAQSEHTD